MVSKVTETDAALDGEEPVELETTDGPAIEDDQEPEISTETLDDVRRKARINMPQADLDDPQMDATRLYLSEIGYSKLLTAEEEVCFSRLAQKGDVAARQADDRKQPAAGGQDRPTLYEPWAGAARFDRGGELRSDTRSGEVRS